MKVIFLDIDGVLNSDLTKERTKQSASVFVSDIYIRHLKEIIDVTGAVIVLSSDWRLDRDDKRYNADFLQLKEKLLNFGIEIFDFTPNFNNARGGEIQSWIESHPEVGNFVILDDRTDVGPNEDKLVQTIPAFGLTHDLVQDAINILTKRDRESDGE